MNEEMWALVLNLLIFAWKQNFLLGWILRYINYTSIKLFFCFLFKKHFLLIIQSNNLSRKMSTDLVTYLTNAKHVLFSLKTNQGHINCIRDAWKQYQKCGLCDLMLSDALLTELWDSGNVTFSVRSTLCWETESEGWSQLYGLQACTTVAPRKKLGKHLS